MLKIYYALPIVLVQTTPFLCYMITMGTSFLKKLYVLLAVLLCSVLVIAMPVVSHAGTSTPVAHNLSVDESADSSFTITAGEVSPGDAEAVLQLDKAPLAQLIQSVLEQRYPVQPDSPAIPAFYSFLKKDSGLYAILTKGP